MPKPRRSADVARPAGPTVLLQEVLDHFCPRFTPGGRPLHIGRTARKRVYHDEKALETLLGVAPRARRTMPDIVVYHEARSRLVLVHAVTGHGPLTPRRCHQLKELFRASKAALVFVNAFLTRRDLGKYLSEIAWETVVWVAESPAHLIHFDGQRLLGPFEESNTPSW